MVLRGREKVKTLGAMAAGWKEWFLGAMACFALMVNLGADLSGIGGEAAAGGFFVRLAVQIKKLEYVLPVFDYKNAVLAFLVFAFFLKTGDTVWRERLSKWSYRIPAMLTAFFLVFGYSFQYTNSWNLVFMDTFHRLTAAGMAAGFYVLFSRIFRLLLLRVCRAGEEQAASAGKLTELVMERHAFWGPLLVILLCWFPYILAKYPGAAMPETLAEMRQYYWNAFNNYYPVLHTVLLGLLMEAGNRIASYTFGFFLNLLVQLALLLSAFSYGFVLMKRWRTPYGLRWLALGIICVVQFFPMESTIVEKDVPYTACVIFLVLMLYELVRTMRTGARLSAGQIAGFCLSGLGMACFRNEGFYLTAAAGVSMSVYACRLRWKEDRAGCVRILAAMLLPAVLFTGYQKLLLPACKVEDNGLQEALSIPFQQTARYVRDYGYELTEEEEQVLSRVLDYENLAELYDPVTSDPVKYTYCAQSAGDLADYFRLWLAQLFRHPGSAVQATMNNAYGWFYQEGYAHNYMMTSQIEGHEVRWEIVQPERLAGLRQVVERAAKLLSRAPVVNWFENTGFVSWMTILLIAFWAGGKQKRYLLSAVPLLVALLVCVAAPAFRYQVRYIMPIMFCVPYYLPMAVHSLREQEAESAEPLSRAAGRSGRRLPFLLLLLTVCPLLMGAGPKETYAFYADSEEEARSVAQSLGAELRGFYYGIASIEWEGGTARSAAGEKRTVRTAAGEVRLYPDEPYEVDLPAAEEAEAPWHLTAIHAEKAWELTRGAGVQVAVLDTGIDAEHEALKDAVLYSGTAVPASFYGEGGTFPESYRGAQDNHGHGTHVAGIIGARSGSPGVAPECALLSIKVLDNSGGKGKGMTSWVAAAIREAADLGADVINLSMGGNHITNELLHEAIQEANERQIVVVCASGNASTSTVYYPAGYDETISVSAVKQSGDTVAFASSYSNYGDWIDLCAPGSAIQSTVPGGYQEKSGTSMACAVVSGAAALLLSEDENLSPGQVLEHMAETSADLGEPGKDALYGYGMIDLEEMLKRYRTQAPLPAPETDVPTGRAVCEGTRIRLHTATADAQIRYTLDGSEPCADSTLYTEEGIRMEYQEDPVVLSAKVLRGESECSESAVFHYQVLRRLSEIEDKKGTLGEEILPEYGTYEDPVSGKSCRRYHLTVKKKEKLTVRVDGRNFTPEIRLYDSADHTGTLLGEKTGAPAQKRTDAASGRQGTLGTKTQKLVWENRTGSEQEVWISVSAYESGGEEEDQTYRMTWKTEGTEKKSGSSAGSSGSGGGREETEESGWKEGETGVGSPSLPSGRPPSRPSSGAEKGPSDGTAPMDEENWLYAMEPASPDTEISGESEGTEEEEPAPAPSRKESGEEEDRTAEGESGFRYSFLPLLLLLLLLLLFLLLRAAYAARRQTDHSEEE